MKKLTYFLILILLFIAGKVDGQCVSAGPAMAAICQGGPSAALGGSYGLDATSAIWSDGGAGGSFTDNLGDKPDLATYTASVTSGPSVTLTLTAHGGIICDLVSDSKVITVDPASIGGSVSGGTTICSGSTSGLLTLSGQTGVVIRWQSSVSPFSTWTDIANTATTYTSVALTQTTQFRAEVQSGSCAPANSSTTTVTVDPASIGGSVSGGTTICSGSTSGLLTLSGQTGVVIRWQSSVSPFSTWTDIANTATTYTSVALTQTTQFRAVVQSGSCAPANSSTTTVMVTPQPEASISYTGSPWCTSEGVQNVTLVGTSGGTFSAPAGLTINTSTGAITTSTSTAGTYVVTYTIAPTGGCGITTATTSVTISPTPIAPVIEAITQPTCSVATGSVPLSGLLSGDWTLTRNPGGEAILGSGTSTTIANLAPGTYTFTVTNSAGCISPSSLNVIIDAQPPTPVVPAQTASISSGGTFTVTPSGVTIPAGTTYTWPAPTYTGFVTGGVAQLTPQLNISGTLTNPSGVGTAIYDVTPTSGPCTGTNFLVTVTVISTCVPVDILTQPTNTSMCATSGSASFTLVPSGTDPFNYQWQYNNGGTWGAVVNGTPAGALYSNSTTPTLNVSGITSAGSPQYRCFITNCEGGNNTTSNIVSLTVNALPTATLISSDADNIFCQGTTVTFTAGGGTHYNFRVGGATRQSGPSTTFPINYLTNGQLVDVIVTNSGCSATSAQIQNIVNSLPLIVVTSSAACSPSWLTYSVGVTVSPGGVVTCTEPLATITNTSGDIWAITDIPAGTTVEVIVTVINGCTNSIHVLAPDCNCPVVPAPVSGGDKSYCAGGVIPALTMTVTTGKTADWYNSSSGGTPVLSGSLSYTPSIAGTYYALAREISSGCVSSTRTAVTLTMNPLPITSLTSSDIDNVFCAGTSIIFTATGGTNYNFLVGGVSEQDGASANYTTNALTNGQVVIVMVTNADGCSEISAPLTNTVNPSPAPTLTSSDADNIFCAGASVTFTAGGGTMYDFRIDGITVQSGTVATYTTNLLTNGQIVNVVVSNANCSATSSNIVNSVNPVPIPELVSSDADNTFCAGTSVTFTAGGGTNFDFRVGGISVQNGTLSAYTTTSLTNGQVVDVIVANSTGCSVTSTGISNTVNPQPVTNAGTGGNVCDLKFRFNAVPSTGIGTWTKTTGPGTATFDPNPNTPNATVTVSEYGTYTFTWTEVSGPCSGSSTITVNFYQQPVAVAETGSNNCGLGFHFNASLNVGTGTWVKESGPGDASFSPDANTANALVTVTAYGTYNFSWTVVNGTCSDTAYVNVVFIEQLPADAGSGGSECDKDFILNANVTTTGTGTWTKASGPGNAVFTPDNHQPDAKVSVDQSGSYDFAWTVVNSTCNSTDMVSVVFHDLPVINAGRDTAFCKGSSVQLQAIGTGSFSWAPVEFLSNPDIMNPVATPDTTTTFEVSLIDQFGCKNKDSVIVEVRDMLLADAGPDQELGYLYFTNMDAELAHNYETGVWTVISGTGEFTDSTSANTRVEGLSPGPNEFLWTVSNGFCPLSMDSVNIVVHGFVIPTLITPNMDGRNDYFVLKGITTLGKTELSIFDRRGAMVYSNLDYDNSWNGVDYNENALPDDTYFYVLKTENGKSLSGYIVIRR